ncbi:hypothetical protein [Bradyrhizobium diazoefficiens]
MGIIGAILLIGGLYLVGAYGIPAWLILFAITTGLGFLSYKTTVPGDPPRIGRPQTSPRTSQHLSTPSFSSF